MEKAGCALAAVAIMFFCLTAHNAAAADKAAPGGMTDKDIRAIYQQSVDILKQPYADYLSFLSRSVTNDYIETDNVTTNVAGRPAAQNTEKHTKATLLKEARTVYDAAKHAIINCKVVHLAVAHDGQSAAVTQETTISNIAIPQPGGRVLLGESHSRCHDNLVLSPTQGIQISRSVCTLDINISKGQSL